MSDNVKLHFPTPPNEIFKNQRTGLLLNEKNVVYLIERMEAIEHIGVCTKYVGVPYLKYGFPTPEAIFAINQVKKIILTFVKLCKNPLLLAWVLTENKTKLCENFNMVFNKLFGHQALDEGFMCRSAFNFANFVHSFLLDIKVENTTAKEFAFNLAQILEYDDAYRYRFQDLMTEMNLDDFNKNPRKEIKRLYEIMFKRSSDGVVTHKVVYLFKFVSFLAIFYKKSIVKSSAFLKQAQLDENDRYWVCLRADNYNYLGLSVEERHELYTERPQAYEAWA